MGTFFQIALGILVGLPLLLVALALAGGMLGHFSLQRSIKIAANRPCPTCGKAVGRRAVEAARRRQTQKLRAIMERYLRPRVRPEWEIVCPHCGSPFLFNPTENRIEAAPISADAAKI